MDSYVGNEEDIEALHDHLLHAHVAALKSQEPYIAELASISETLRKHLENEKAAFCDFEARVIHAVRQHAEANAEVARLYQDLHDLEREAEDLQHECKELRRIQMHEELEEHKTQRTHAGKCYDDLTEMNSVELVHEITVREDLLRSLEDRLLVLQGKFNADDLEWAVEVAKQAATSMSTPSAGMCAGKQDDAQISDVTEDAAMRELAALLKREWEGKPGTLLEELVANLKSPMPAESQAHEREVILRLASGARGLRDKPSLIKKGNPHSLAELAVLWLYTAHGADIDRLMGFEVPQVITTGTPVEVKESKAAWEHYTKTLMRNEAIFSEVNWALRVMGSGDRSVDTEQKARRAIRKWAKYIGVLAAITSRPTADGGGSGLKLFRGFGGQSDDMFSAIARKSGGAMVYWPSFSSCALDRAVSVSYIDGSAANAVAKEGKGLLFSIDQGTLGVPLWDISQYPEEQEQLLPPLSSFRISTAKESEDIRTSYRRELRKVLTQSGRAFDEVVKAVSAVDAMTVHIKLTSSLCLTAISDMMQSCTSHADLCSQQMQSVLDELDTAAQPEDLERLREEVISRQVELDKLIHRKGELSHCLVARQADVSRRTQRMTKMEREREALETHLRSLDEACRREEEELLGEGGQHVAPEHQMQAGVMKLKAAGVNLVNDYRFIGQVRERYMDDPQEGFDVSLRYISSVVAAVHGAQTEGGRWVLRKERGWLRQLPHEELVQLLSAVKQLLVCYDMLELTEPPTVVARNLRCLLYIAEAGSRLLEQ